MATPSPAPSNTSVDTTTTTTTTTPTTTTATAPTTIVPSSFPTSFATSKPTMATPIRAINGGTPPHRDPPKNLRGLNKPKCSKCGNVARSRCPFQSCKSCCAKAQNPCHIHVLKANPLPDKTPASSSPSIDKQSTDASPSGASLRVSSLRQLSQFNGSQVPYTARRPLTRKDAIALNQWRFAKLKEYKESCIEAENEAFDRYIQNISLLEEAFFVDSLSEGTNPDDSHVSGLPINREDNFEKVISVIKLQLRSDPKRRDTFRYKIEDIVDQGLNNLRKLDCKDNEEGDVLDGEEPRRPKKAKIQCAERISAFYDLIDKLNKARNEDDLQSCLRMKSQIFNQQEEANSTENKAIETAEQQVDDGVSKRRQDSACVFPRLCSRLEVNQETLQSIEAHFCSLDQADQIDDL